MAAIGPIVTFARVIVFVSAAAWSNWSTIEGLFDAVHTEPDEPIFGHYCQFVFGMQNAAGSFTTDERGIFGIHYLNTTGGALDTTWTAADFASVELAAAAWWSGSTGKFSTGCRLEEFRWYPFGPGVAPPNPPARITTLATPIAGTNALAWPHQMAGTVTFRTTLRAHWGRIYVPWTPAGVGPTGRNSAAIVDGMMVDVLPFLTDPGESQGVVPVVWDRNRKSAFTITALEIDDVPDVIRRRRPAKTNYRKIVDTSS